MNDWAEKTFQKLIEKYLRTAPLAAVQNIIPYKSDGNRWAGSPSEGDAWWTGGFWPGLMWQLYAATGQDVFRAEAVRVEKRLVNELCYFKRLYHDVGFMYLLSCGANWMFTGDRDSKRNLLHAATILAGRFNLAGSYIRAWNEDKAGWAIIDSMMNLSLLFWASRETKDPRYHQIAVRHADTALREFVREDGSCNHIVIFDPNTGRVLQKPAGQGFAAGSSWSRGQAWALYGFGTAYAFTRDLRFLETAQQCADYYIARTPRCGVPPNDWDDPNPPTPYESSAAAIAASGLLDLATLTGDSARAWGYRDYALTIIATLLGPEFLADATPDWQGLLKHGIYHARKGLGVDESVMWGEYFFL